MDTVIVNNGRRRDIQVGQLTVGNRILGPFHVNVGRLTLTIVANKLNGVGLVVRAVGGVGIVDTRAVPISR